MHFILDISVQLKFHKSLVFQKWKEQSPLCRYLNSIRRDMELLKSHDAMWRKLLSAENCAITSKTRLEISFYSKNFTPGRQCIYLICSVYKILICTYQIECKNQSHMMLLIYFQKLNDQNICIRFIYFNLFFHHSKCELVYFRTEKNFNISDIHFVFQFE